MSEDELELQPFFKAAMYNILMEGGPFLGSPSQVQELLREGAGVILSSLDLTFFTNEAGSRDGRVLVSFEDEASANAARYVSQKPINN